MPVRALVCALAAALVPPLPQLPRYVERVDVARVLIDVRAVDNAGRPLRGLAPRDFAVRIDGERARIDSLDWIDGTTPERSDAEAIAPVNAGPSFPGGRLIVLLFQKDLEPSRIIGLMRMLIDWQPFLDSFTPLDRIAVVSFDSHLKVWTDFTSDLDRIRRVLRHGLLFERPPPLVETSPPSLLANGLTIERGRRTYSIERALIAIGDALKPLPGAKSLVMIGHGFGRFSREGVSMENDYAAARDALVAARAAVFSLDVTQADYHSLEAGLKLVSEDTGGFYASTYQFPKVALDRIAGALAGHYVLFVETRPLKPGRHRLSVDLNGKKGVALASSEIVVS